MASDQVVNARDVLHSVLELRRRGSQQVLEDLEQQEPDLMEYLLEELSGTHRQVLEMGGRPRQERQVRRRMESLALVLVMSLRQAHLRLWRQEAADSPLAKIDPTLAEGQPPPPRASDDSST